MNFFHKTSPCITKATYLCIVFLLINTLSLFATEIPSPVKFQKALQDAQYIASMNPNWTVMEAEGDSMSPHYGSNALLVIEKTEFKDLSPGMIAIYKDKDGDYVGHIILEKTPDGYIAQGYNNTNKDPQLVRADNLVGTLFATLYYAPYSRNSIVHLPIVYGKTY